MSEGMFSRASSICDVLRVKAHIFIKKKKKRWTHTMCMFSRGNNFCDFLFAFLYTVPSEKGATVKGKSFDI